MFTIAEILLVYYTFICRQNIQMLNLEESYILTFYYPCQKNVGDKESARVLKDLLSALDKTISSWKNIF